MAEGYEIKVVPAKDPTATNEMFLPKRKPKWTRTKIAR
jgi:hypothetical protein